MKKTMLAKPFHAVLATTIAGGLLLGATNVHAFDWFRKDDEERQERINRENLRRPVANPDTAVGEQYTGGSAIRRPANNPGGAIGDPTYVTPETVPEAQPRQPAPAPAAKKDDGFFSFLYREEESPVDLSQRRVPKGNANPSADLSAGAGAAYETAMPVSEVEMSPLSEEQGGMETGGMEEEAYPELADVPPVPERLENNSNTTARFDELISAREASQSQRETMEAQVAMDAEGHMESGAEESWDSDMKSLETEFGMTQSQPQTTAPAAQEPVTQEPDMDALQAEFAALVSSPEPVTAAQPQQGMFIAVEQPDGSMGKKMDAAPMEQAEMASYAAPVQPVASWEPEPLIEPQAAPVMQEEWVDLREGVQEPVAVDQVNVVNLAEPVSVSPVPVQDAGQVMLAPPPGVAAGVRTLPESRYSARRQAVQMERYARRAEIMRYNAGYE